MRYVRQVMLSTLITAFLLFLLFKNGRFISRCTSYYQVIYYQPEVILVQRFSDTSNSISLSCLPSPWLRTLIKRKWCCSFPLQNMSFIILPAKSQHGVRMNSLISMSLVRIRSYRWTLYLMSGRFWSLCSISSLSAKNPSGWWSVRSFFR